MHLGRERPPEGRAWGRRQGAADGGRSRPSVRSLGCDSRADCDTGGTERRPLHRRRSRSLARTSTDRSAVNRRSRAPRASTDEPRVQKGEQCSRVLCSPPVSHSKSNSRQPGDGTRVCAVRRGIAATRDPASPERQHPDARPAFVNRQERASLDVLTMRFECPGDDAARPHQRAGPEFGFGRRSAQRRRWPRGLPRSRGRS